MWLEQNYFKVQVLKTATSEENPKLQAMYITGVQLGEDRLNNKYKIRS